MSIQIALSKLIAPANQDGTPDHRHNASLKRILEEIGEETAKSLLQFAESTALLQRRAADDGLRLAMAIFKEASYLDRHHRYDDDNLYGWQSKRLRKQAQRMLESVGFKRNNAHKLVTTAGWLVGRYTPKDEQQWFDTLTPSHLYELSRMSFHAFEAAKSEVSYENFAFCAGQQPITVRRLEELRREIPIADALSDAIVIEVSQDSAPNRQLYEDSDRIGVDVAPSEMVQQFVSLARAIDWPSIKQEKNVMESLSTIERTLCEISRLVELWNCGVRPIDDPCDQLEMDLKIAF